MRKRAEIFGMALLALLLFATPFASAQAQNASGGTQTINGKVIVSKDKSGKAIAAVLKTDSAVLAIPTARVERFAAYEGRDVRVSCSINGKIAIPLCVIGLANRQQSVPGGRLKI